MVTLLCLSVAEYKKDHQVVDGIIKWSMFNACHCATNRLKDAHVAMPSPWYSYKLPWIMTM